MILPVARGRMTKLILHIGGHRTGSTSIQAALSSSFDELLKNGILYPKAGLDTVARTLAGEGAVLSTITLPSLGEFAAVNRVILNAKKADDTTAFQIAEAIAKPVVPVAAPAPAEVHSSAELLERITGTASDAPMCFTCGTKMRPAGSCYVCEGCGSTSGCS